MHWHFLSTAAADGPWNMALDEALMRRTLRTGDAVFRVYGWSSPVLSLGRNQVARYCYDVNAAEALGVSFVRRPTGGRALLHHREVTYSVTMPCEGPGSAGAAYHFISEMLLSSLSALGVSASRARATSPQSAGPTGPPGLRPCFDQPSAHEIVVSDRKLVGSAQWRHDGVLLQHGSILVHDDQQLIARVMTESTGRLAAAATLSEALGREPAAGEVAAHLLASLRSTVDQPVRCLELDAELRAHADEFRAVYASNAWTWRR